VWYIFSSDLLEILGSILKVEISHIKKNTTKPVDPIATRPNDAKLSTARLKEVGIDVTCVDFDEFFKLLLQ
jgi:hypothetical protein